jgi:hypothetical protein
MKKIFALFFLVVFVVIGLASMYAGITSRPSSAGISAAPFVMQVTKLEFRWADSSGPCKSGTIYTSLPPKCLTDHGLKPVENPVQIVPVQKP